MALCCFCSPITHKCLLQHIIKQLFRSPAIVISLMRFSFLRTGCIFIAGQRPRCHVSLDLTCFCTTLMKPASTDISGRFKIYNYGKDHTFLPHWKYPVRYWTSGRYLRFITSLTFKKYAFYFRIILTYSTVLKRVQSSRLLFT